MRRTQAAGRVEAQSTKNTVLDTAALAYAVRIIHQVCCLAGSFDLVEEFRDQDLSAAIERHDSAVLFDRQLSRDFGRDRHKLHAPPWPSDLALSSQKPDRATELSEAAILLALP